MTASSSRSRKSPVRKMTRKRRSPAHKRRRQGYNDKIDESLGARDGKKRMSAKGRRHISEAMAKRARRRKYSRVSTMDAGAKRPGSKKPKRKIRRRKGRTTDDRAKS